MPPQKPLRHETPVAHWATLPHWQPSAPQRSPRVMSQAAQVMPPVPQELTVPGLRQLTPEQQPGHDIESQMQAPVWQRSPAPQVAIAPHLQTWLTQLSPPTFAQFAQLLPPAPQAVATLPATQVLPLQ